MNSNDQWQRQQRAEKRILFSSWIYFAATPSLHFSIESQPSFIGQSKEQNAKRECYFLVSGLRWSLVKDKKKFFKVIGGALTVEKYILQMLSIDRQKINYGYLLKAIMSILIDIWVLEHLIAELKLLLT